MDPLVQGTLIFLLASGLIQLVLVLAYVSAHRRKVGCRVDDSELPTAAVLMAIRGGDPDLPAAIRSVLDQEYPEFRLHVILDSEEDPARSTVEETLRSASEERVTVSVLENKPDDRSLMCSCAVQFLEELDPSCELMAFCASDMVVPRGWLREMAQALANPGVGGTLGNRWYTPRYGGAGSMVRYLWNAGAVVLMRLFQIPWSGGLGMRPDDVRRSGLAERWRHGMIEDVPAFRALRDSGLSFEHRPALTVVDSGEVGLAGAFAFIKRQLLWARLYHPLWPMLIPHALLGTASLLVPVALAVRAFWTGAAPDAVWLLAGLGIYILGLAWLLWLIETAVLEQAGSPERSGPRWPRVAAAIPLCQLLYGVAVLACLFTRTVRWRGITYRVGGPWKVKMLDYRPARTGDGG